MNYDQVLDVDVHGKRLVYRSEGKLRNFLLKQESRAVGITFPKVVGVNVGDAHKEERALLTGAGRALQDQRAIAYESQPRVGSYFLVRFVGRCGSMWPFTTHTPELENVAWWVGESSAVKLLAFGHRDNLLASSRRPSSGQDKGTWWPSDVGTHAALLASVSLLIQDESVDSAKELNGAKFAALSSYCFNEGVYRHQSYLPRGIFDALIRVDGVDEEDGTKPVVYGSPVWVAAVDSPPPGTYTIEPRKLKNLAAVGTWDGDSWVGTNWVELGEPILVRDQRPQPSPPVPDTEPDTADVLHLGMPETSESNTATEKPTLKSRIKAAFTRTPQNES